MRRAEKTSKKVTHEGETSKERAGGPLLEGLATDGWWRETVKLCTKDDARARVRNDFLVPCNELHHPAATVDHVSPVDEGNNRVRGQLLPADPFTHREDFRDVRIPALASARVRDEGPGPRSEVNNSE